MSKCLKAKRQQLEFSQELVAWQSSLILSAVTGSEITPDELMGRVKKIPLTAETIKMFSSPV